MQRNRADDREQGGVARHLQAELDSFLKGDRHQ
jgi:hypothetical protein